MEKQLSLRFQEGFAVIAFDQPGSKVNTLSSQSMAELSMLVKDIQRRVSGGEALKGLCFVSLKPDIFIAGADIKEIESIATPREAEDKSRAGQKIFAALEALPVPSIALINGACLGGGMELALACDWRLAGYSDKVKMGLPEVKLGILPGFGGTVRLSRLVGLRKALEMILSGDPLSSTAAFKAGLVDGLASEQRLLTEGMAFLAKKGAKRRHGPPGIKGFLNRFLENTAPGRALLIAQTKKFVMKTTKGQYPAPLKALEVVAANRGVPFAAQEAAYAREAAAFGSLACGEIAKNLISIFYLLEKYKKIKWVEAEPYSVRSCAVLGAGVMGGGIAQLLSRRGYPVRMKDINHQALGRGLKQAWDVYKSAVKSRKMKPHQMKGGMALITTTTDYTGFGGIDLVIEAVVEDQNIKKKVWAEVGAVVKPETLIVSNTSCLSVAQMASALPAAPERGVGMHFFNPVHRMPLVEVVRAEKSSDRAVATVVEFSRALGKTPLVVKDAGGFLVNRILLPFLNEAGLLLEEGVPFTRIDDILLRFGAPMGAFILMDEIGLDVGYKVAHLLEECFGERMKVSGVFKAISEKKWYGKKSGRGFYVHAGKKRTPNPEVANLVSAHAAPPYSDEDVLNRILFRMIDEAARCLEDNICREASDVDIGMLLGTGFPPFRGGFLRYADKAGAAKIVETLERWKKATGAERFTPCRTLSEMARDNRRFHS